MFGNMQTKGSGEKGLVLPAIFSYIVTLFWLALPSLQLTGSREYWTPPLALLAKHANLITVCRSFYMTNFTGSAYNSGSTSSCVQLFTGVSSARLHHIWSTSASHCPTLPVDSTYDLPTVTNFMYSVIVARCSAVGPSLLLAQRPGTHCETTFEIRHCQLPPHTFRVGLKTLLLSSY